MLSDEILITPRAPRALGFGTRLRAGQVIDWVGGGSTGHVYRVVDENGMQIAVREYFPPEIARREGDEVLAQDGCEAAFRDGRKLFEEDGWQLAAQDHPGLLKVLQVWPEHGTVYLSMPWCEGHTLAEMVRASPMPPSQAQLSNWLRAMADALTLVHRRRGLHGNLSPGQVMLLDSGRLLLMEFARSRRFVTRDPREIERDPFAALECGTDPRCGPTGPWTDVYALAAILYFVLRGRAPQAAVRRAAFDAQEPLTKLAGSDYTETFLQGIDDGLALKPRARPQSLPAFLEGLGLRERRVRQRATGESLLINLPVADAGTVEATPAGAGRDGAEGPAAGSSAQPATTTQPAPNAQAGQTEPPDATEPIGSDIPTPPTSQAEPAQSLQAAAEEPVADRPEPPVLAEVVEAAVEPEPAPAAEALLAADVPTAAKAASAAEAPDGWPATEPPVEAEAAAEPTSSGVEAVRAEAPPAHAPTRAEGPTVAEPEPLEAGTPEASSEPPPAASPADPRADWPTLDARADRPPTKTHDGVPFREGPDPQPTAWPESAWPVTEDEASAAAASYVRVTQRPPSQQRARTFAAMAGAGAVALLFGAWFLQVQGPRGPVPIARTVPPPPAPAQAPAAVPAPSPPAVAAAERGASWPIPDPLEPTAAGPATAPPTTTRPAEPTDLQAPLPPAAAPVEGTAPSSRVEGTAPVEGNMPSAPEAAATGQPPTAEPPPVRTLARPRAPVAAPPVAAPRATQPPAPAPASESPAAGTASRCPELLARQYTGRALDAAERQELQTQCR